MTIRLSSHLRSVSHQLGRVLLEFRIRKRSLSPSRPSALDAAECPETQSNGNKGTY